MSGWPLIAISFLVFLGPVALAIAGSALAGPAQERQLLGALGGLVAGLVIAPAAGRLAFARPKETA